MNDSDARKKGGRPKMQPDDLPIILAESRSRVQETVTMSTYHQRLFNRYVKWAVRKAGLLGAVLSVEEAKSLLLGQGIDLVLQRDKAWARDRKAEENEDDDVAAAPRAGRDQTEGARNKGEGATESRKGVASSDGEPGSPSASGRAGSSVAAPPPAFRNGSGAPAQGARES
jgi:hypothetical protein